MMPTLFPRSYNGSECIGVIDFDLLAETPVSTIETKVYQAMTYQSPLWLDATCKSRIRQYTCLYFYQQYGVWVIGDSINVGGHYYAETCDAVNSICSDFYSLAEDVDFEYPIIDLDALDTTGEYMLPQDFITYHCYNRSCQIGKDMCFNASTSTVEESQAECPDPLVIPSDKTLAHRHEVHIARYTGSVCAISCPNTWYRSGSFYLNTYILYVISIMSALAGLTAMVQHAMIVYSDYTWRKKEAQWLASSSTTTNNPISRRDDLNRNESGDSRINDNSVDASREKPRNTIISQRVAFLCTGVSLSNIACVCFLLINNLNNYSIQCIGNAGFSKHNSLCFIQGSLVVFTICWQQAWTGLICTDIYAIVRPFSTATKFFKGKLFYWMKCYFCWIHPVLVVIILNCNGYIGNYWQSEYNLCGPSFGESATGDLLFIILIWVPIMLIGPLIVCVLTTQIIITMRQQGMYTSIQVHDRAIISN
jgi:hypothetical protein